jgi:hypothetical protein
MSLNERYLDDEICCMAFDWHLLESGRAFQWDISTMGLEHGGETAIPTSSCLSCIF